MEIVGGCYSLEKIKQKSTESYCKYAYKWRKEVAQVRPSMYDIEIVEVSIRIKDPLCYDMIILLIGAKCAEIVNVGEATKYGIKIGKIFCVAPPPNQIFRIVDTEERRCVFHLLHI